MIAEAWRNNVGSVCTALPTLLGPHTLITHGLQRLMGCILPTMHCRSQTCWELLHPFAHHCQHARNNSQNRWRNNVGSCCARLHAALSPVQTDATLLDVTRCVRLHTMLHVVARSLKPVKLFSQQLPTFLLFRDRRSVAQQCWINLHSSSNSVGATHAHYA